MKKFINFIKDGISWFIYKTDYLFSVVFKKNHITPDLKLSKRTSRTVFNLNLDTLNKESGRECIEYADEIVKGHIKIFNGTVSIDTHVDGFWNIDYKTNARLPMLHCTKMKKAIPDGVDIKHLWEIGRMHFIPTLALAFFQTKDAKYIQTIEKLINSFYLNCPLKFGPQWMNSMEVGIRAANIVLASDILKKAISDEHDAIFKLLYSFNTINIKYLNIYRENHRGISNNHYLCGLLGKTLILLSQLRNNKIGFNVKKCRKAYETELHKQFLSDGCNYEGSTSYALLSTSIIVYFELAFRNVGLFDGTNDTLLKQILIYIASITRKNGRVFVLGDNDSGLVFSIIRDNNLLSTNISSSLKSILGYSCNRSILTGCHEIFVSDTSSNFHFDLDKECSYFSQGNQCVINKDNFTLFVTNCDMSSYNMGGHEHNDFLSFQLDVNNHLFFVDCGTGCYTGDKNIRNQFKSSKSHSTVFIDGCEPRPLTDNLFSKTTGLKCRMEKPIHQDNGYLIKTSFSFIDKYTAYRTFIIKEQEIDIETSVECLNNKSFVLFFPLHPLVIAKKQSNNSIIIKYKNDTVTFESDDCEIGFIEGLFSEIYDSWEPTKIIQIISEKNSNIVRIMINRDKSEDKTNA